MSGVERSGCRQERNIIHRRHNPLKGFVKIIEIREAIIITVVIPRIIQRCQVTLVFVCESIIIAIHPIGVRTVNCLFPIGHEIGIAVCVEPRITGGWVSNPFLHAI